MREVKRAGGDGDDRIAAKAQADAMRIRRCSKRSRSSSRGSRPRRARKPQNAEAAAQAKIDSRAELSSAS
jgi:hypothetical protein